MAANYQPSSRRDHVSNIAHNPSLSSTESTELAERLADLTRAGLPLPAGLRAAAEDCSTRRLAGVLRMIAAELDSGAKLDDALGTLDRRLPAYVQGVVRAGIRSGELPAVLTRLAQADRQSRQLWRELRLALAYPVVLLVMMFALLALVLYVVPLFEQIFADFELELPAATSGLLAITRLLHAMWQSTLPHVLLWAGAALIALYVPLRITEWIGWSLAGSARLRPLVRAGNAAARWLAVVRRWPARIATTFPLLGPLMLWSQTAQWARLLAVLVEARVPLPDALSLSAEGTRSANMSDLTARLGEGVRDGTALSEQIRRCMWLPMSLVPITAWGEKSGELPQALRTAAEMFEGRVRLRASLIKQIVPPLFFVLIASLALLVLAAVVTPLISLIQNLA